MTHRLSRREMIAALTALGFTGCGTRTTQKISGISARSDVPTSHTSPFWFEEKADALGVHFALGHIKPPPLPVLNLMGTGCAIADFDGDGHNDIFLVGQTGTNREHCALFLNNGNGTFRDATRGSGLETPGFYMGCAVGDIDNDGLPDILVTGYGVNRLYKNQGKGKFIDITRGSGLEAPSPYAWASSAAFADIDLDGRLDLYLARYVVFNAHSQSLCNYGQYKSSCGPIYYDPQIGSLYHNQGKGKFKDITRETGLDAAHGKCLGASFCDVNNDGYPDLYLANDEMPGDLWINEKGKFFHNKGLEMGLALDGAGDMQGGMGIDWGDYDNDGLIDLFVATFEGEPDSLYQATKSGLYNFVSTSVGIDQPTRNMVGFGAKFIDVNNNGWLDIAVANGHIHDNEAQIDKMNHYHQPIQLFMNQQGTHFQESSAQAGPGFTTPAVGRGLATGDLNNDGLIDIVMIDLAGNARVLINKYPNPGNWIRIRLEGTKSNRMGIGARVWVTSSGKRRVQDCTTGGSYLSAGDCRLHFGLGNSTSVEKVEVLWPSGKKSVLSSPSINHDHKIKEI